MGLFGKGANAQIEAWLETVTMAELDAMEQQGLDVKEWKEKVLARENAANLDAEVRFENESVDQTKLSNPVDLNKLKPYMGTPRDVNGEFVRMVAGKLPLFGKDKKLHKVANGVLVYASVVQANSDLWKPGDGSDLPAVLVFAMDEAHRNNIEWLKETAGKIVALKNSAEVPADCKNLIDDLRDDQSIFCWKIGKSISGNADGWCVVYSFDKQSILPRKCLPSEGIVPFILKDEPKEKLGVWFYDIPGNIYQ